MPVQFCLLIQQESHRQIQQEQFYVLFFEFIFVLKRRFTNETGLREGVIQVENHPGVIFLRSDLKNGTEPFAFLSNLGETNVTALVVIRNYTAKYPVPGTYKLAILIKVAFYSHKLSRIRKFCKKEQKRQRNKQTIFLNISPSKSKS